MFDPDRVEVAFEPFAHAVIDDLWDPAMLRQIICEFPAESDPCWQRFDNPQERKLACADREQFGDATLALVDMLCEPDACREVGELFGIEGLTASLDGGGYHQIPRDGLLAMHVDFNRSSVGLYRRVNCLLYLNEGWLPSWGGELVIGRADPISIPPLFNRTVLFATSDRSHHGHPTPWAGDRPRRSIAVYFYSPEPADAGAADDVHSTLWSAA